MRHPKKKDNGINAKSKQNNELHAKCIKNSTMKSMRKSIKKNEIMRNQ